MKGRLIWMMLLLGLCSVGISWAGKTLQVGVKEGPLRAAPAPFGKVLKLLHYGDAVEVLEERKGWSRVRAGSNLGWMHATLLAVRGTQLVTGRGRVEAAASQDELTLAGKGFNSQVEAEYRRQNLTLDYATIDRMETLAVRSAEVEHFVTEGGLFPEEGNRGR